MATPPQTEVTRLLLDWSNAKPEGQNNAKTQGRKDAKNH